MLWISVNDRLLAKLLKKGIWPNGSTGLFHNCTDPLLAGDGGKPEVVLAEVDADGGGEASELLPVPVVTIVVVLVKLRFLRHLSHPLWGRKCQDRVNTALKNSYWKNFIFIAEITSSIARIITNASNTKIAQTCPRYLPLFSSLFEMIPLADYFHMAEEVVTGQNGPF